MTKIKFPEDFAVVAICLRHRTDRLPLVLKAFEMLGRGEIVDAFTPDTAPPKIHPAMDDTKWAVNCSLTKALEKGVSMNKPYVLLLEDDISFEPDAVNRIQKAIDAAPDFDMLYGGWCVWGDNSIESQKKCPVFQYKGDGRITETHCVLFTIDTAIAAIKSRNNIEIYEKAYQKYGSGAGFSSDAMLSMWSKDQNLKVYLCWHWAAYQQGGETSNTGGGYKEYPRWYRNQGL